MKKIICISTIILVMLTLNGCTGKKDTVLARVDEEIITLSDFNKRISRLPEQYQEMVSKSKDRFLDDFIVEMLFFKEAIRRGIGRQKDTKELLEEAKKKILMAKFIEAEVEKKVAVEEAELRDYYEKNKDKFVVPETFKASHILVKSEEKAKEVMAKLSGGESFEELARTESIDLTNRRGGDIGYFKKGQLVPEFEKACLELEVDQVSPIVKTSFGYHIIKLTDKKPSELKKFEDIKVGIESEVTSLKKREKFNHIVQDLKNKAHIEVNYDLIKDDEE